MTNRLFITCIVVALAGTACRRSDPGASAPGAAAGGFAVQAIVVDAKVQPVSESLSLVGTVAANEIKSEADGTVEEVRFTEGQKVKAGDLLLRLDEVKFAAVAAEAEANFKLSRTTYERTRQLFTDKLISQQEFDQVAAQLQANQASLDLKKRQLKDARMLAPFDGVVGARSVSPGQVIAKNTTLTWLVDLDPIKVEFSVPERFVGQLRLGQMIELRVSAWPGRTFRGEVFFIAPVIETATRTALVKARVANPEHELRPGMFANLDLALRLKAEALVIPESAVMASGDRTIIYVVDSNDLAQIRPVTLGIRQAGLVEVATGLKAGERVVAEGIQKIRPGGKVKAVPPSTPSEATGPSHSEGGRTNESENGEASKEKASSASER
jgi:membrane fusion protein (multidrug efflux system)